MAIAPSFRRRAPVDAGGRAQCVQESGPLFDCQYINPKATHIVQARADDKTLSWSASIAERCSQDSGAAAGPLFPPHKRKVSDVNQIAPRGCPSGSHVASSRRSSTEPSWTAPGQRWQPGASDQGRVSQEPYLQGRNDTEVPILVHRGESLLGTTCKGTLRHRGHKSRTVKNGTKIRFTHAGNYMLKVSTRDNKHHFQYQTFAFRIK